MFVNKYIYIYCISCLFSAVHECANFLCGNFICHKISDITKKLIDSQNHAEVCRNRVRYKLKIIPSTTGSRVEVRVRFPGSQ